ncbi:uroplakin-2 [Amblyraja radiata]|uniref:uroplakin-2 n=1 Tax=Amblyraja radiata TaxID=386614 RepID=UPI0014038E46|nr:uroplakin-2 [Amblyraja radiata]
MKLLILLALASISWAQDFTISLAIESTGQVVGSLRSMSAIVTLPPCNLAGDIVSVNVANSTGQGPAQPDFERPVCRSRRDLINLVSNVDGFSQTLNLGYKVEMLNPGTMYNVSFRAGTRNSNVLGITTISPTDYTTVDTGFGRSGAMVVITVILVIAMVALIIAFIVVLVLSK